MTTSTRLSYEQTVPRHLVHKAAVAEVFVTDFARIGVDAFAIGIQWPRSHSFYRHHNAHYDRFLAVESARQAAECVAHAMYNMPTTTKYLMRSLSISFKAGGLRVTDRPADVYLSMDVTPEWRRDDSMSAFAVRAQFSSGEDTFAHGQGAGLCLSARAYSRIRDAAESSSRIRSARNDTVEPSRVGHECPGNVLIGERSFEGLWPVRMAVNNAVLFDHPSDHAPGMLLAEAIRQAARAQSGIPAADIAELSIQFPRFTELNAPAHISLVASADNAVSSFFARVLQNGETTAAAKICLVAPGN